MSDICTKIFGGWEVFSPNNATVSFYRKDNIIGFDSSGCTPPDPMINAFVGLNLLKDNETLIMINHRPPMGLFPHIQSSIDYKQEEIDGFFKITFTPKPGVARPSFDESASNHG